MRIEELIDQAYETAESKVFWDEGKGLRNKGEMIALMHSELSEALEEIRSYSYDDHEIYFTGTGDNKEPQGVAVELADVMIRIADFCGGFDIPLCEALELKLEYNKTRAFRHGKSF